LKFKAYKGQELKGLWLLTWKIDGVHAIFKRDGVYSKRGKPLSNMDHLDLEGSHEIFKDNWETSVSMVRTLDSDPVDQKYCYQLDPPDPRLVVTVLENPSDEEIAEYLEEAQELGHEGVMLNQRDVWYKVKPIYSVDVKVSGLQEGTGQHLGKLGAFLTEWGKVGTGFTVLQREEYFTEDMIGELIEVDFMEWTSGGKFRHPRFKRVRWDKDEENLENE